MSAAPPTPAFGMVQGLPTVPGEVLHALGAGAAWAVIPHVLPDVDALASASALCLALRRSGKCAAVFAPDVPAIHRWALGADLAATGEPGADWQRVAVDTARPDRLQWPGPVAVNIDHHEDNPGFGRLNWVHVAPACTCLVAAVAAGLGVPADPRLSTSLYTGLVGDTEGFRVNVGAEAFAWAARFAAEGAETESVAESFHRRSAAFWGYLAAVEGAAFSLDGPVACRVCPIPADLPGRFGLLPYENALLPSHLSPPDRGVLAILQEGRDNVRFRLRSRGVDLLPLAHSLGGGGHPQAAGVMMQGASLDLALARLREAWMEALAQR